MLRRTLGVTLLAPVAAGPALADAVSDAIAAAFAQALALMPDGIVIDGSDAVEQQPLLTQACDAKIPLVSWHAGPVIGPDLSTAWPPTSRPTP